MVSSLESEKEAKNAQSSKGSEDDPLEWKSPLGTNYQVYKENGKWQIKGQYSEQGWMPLENEEYINLLDEEFSGIESEMPELSESKADESDFELEKKALSPEEGKKLLAQLDTQKQVISDYQLGKSTGAIAKSLGMAQDKVSRNAIRNILKKAGVYKQKPVAFSTPAASKVVAHEEIKGTSAAVALYQKLSEQMGSNPGGLYMGSDGKKRYVKFYQDKVQASCEMLSNNIYRDLGIGAPISTVFDDNGKAAFASNYLEGAATFKSAGLTKENAKKFMKGFAADVLLKNWDAVGTGMDNAVIYKNEVFRVDNGGSLLYRAKAGKKPDSSLNDMSEMVHFFNSGKNPYYSQVARAAGYTNIDSMGQELISQINDIEQLVKVNGGWQSYIDKVNPQLDAQSKYKVAQMLETRTQALKGTAQSLSEQAAKKGVQAQRAEQTKLHQPTQYDPGKLTHYAKKYTDTLGSSPSHYNGQALIDQYYKEAGIKNGSAVKSALLGWGATSHGKKAALMKMIAAEYYGKDYTAEPKLDATVKSYYNDY